MIRVFLLENSGIPISS